MQIDFHHGTTYVVARLAGFSHKVADIVAYASQYVDDATSSGAVLFENKAMYNRISSAHKMIDPRNSRELANHLVWMPFHFLPGNGGLKARSNPEGSFIEKIVCSRNSPVAQEMVRQAILEKDQPYGLHRLGITMHVYADTWAHEGFAGVIHPINDVDDVKEVDASGAYEKSLRTLLANMIDDAIPPLGHGRAMTFPDMPFLKWEYTNYKKERVSRNNTDLFCDAADNMCKVMQRYIAGDPNKNVSGISKKNMTVIRDLFIQNPEKDGEKRHAAWLKAIREDSFGFGKKRIKYEGKGKNSWKEKALGTNFDLPVHTYEPDFLKSDWKLFHDGLQAHRLYVIHNLLPNYGICAA